MKSIKYTTIDFIKTSKIGKPIYRKFKKYRGNSGIQIEDLQAINPVAEDGEEIRYNLILPTLRKTKVFGGILTTIKILNKMIARTDTKARVIVVLKESYNPKWTYSIHGFGYNDEKRNQLVFLGDDSTLKVKKNDVFIFTSWRTAYLMMPVLNWQIANYSLVDRKAVYLIQDFEPGFFPWSTEFMLAESTYKTNPKNIIALYNSKELYEYFLKKEYGFYAQKYFEPSLNDELKKKLLNNLASERKKQILIYGRPSEYRNAYEIIKGALIIWSKQYPSAGEWEIISLGEDYEDVKLENNVIHVQGKLSLSGYADVLLSSYAGISLMVSPHPSYPPLEMSTFGVKTITNSFENKDLTYFNSNIISIDNCTPNAIAEKLSEICDEYGSGGAVCYTDNDYVNGGQFDAVISEIGDAINEMVNKDQGTYKKDANEDICKA